MDSKKDTDLTGRDSLLKNVLFSWGGQFVFIAAGFILPRLIDGKLGTEQLGVWDFGWSIVAYFYFVQMSVTDAVNRFVGRYFAAGDVAGINRIVSTATFILSIAGLVVLLLAGIFASALPSMFGSRLGEHLPTARSLVIILGAGIGATTALGAFTGILTGCHRWDLQNTVRAGWHIVSIGGMVLSLMLGGGIVSLGLITVIGWLVTQLHVTALSFRICKGLRLSRSGVEWTTIKQLYAYGGKSLLPTLSMMLLTSTVSVFILGFLGPVALALYSRPRALLRHVDTLVRRMTMTLIPTTSSLESTGDLEGVRSLLIKSVRYALYLVLPAVVTLCVFGGVVLELWMGEEFADGWLIGVLALGFLTPMAITPARDILAGLNAHGRSGIAEFIAALVSIGLVYASLGPLELGLIGAALGVTIPITLMNLLYVPHLICARVEMKLSDYWCAVAKAPLLHILPFLACLVFGRLVLPQSPILAMIVSGSVGGIILAVIYWRHVLPQRMKDWFLRIFEKCTRSFVKIWRRKDKPA